MNEFEKAMTEWEKSYIRSLEHYHFWLGFCVAGLMVILVAPLVLAYMVLFN